MENLLIKAEGKPEKKVELPEEVMCTICTELMAVPTALAPCMHTFCKKCIDQFINLNDFNFY